jgi:Phosphorylated CTD interacting factor 1 WW domain
MRFVEDELYRKELYMTWLSKTVQFIKANGWNTIHFKTVAHLLLRQIFLRIIVRKDELDDPVFITTISEEADKQLIKDLVYETNTVKTHPQENLTARTENVLKYFLNGLQFCAKQMRAFQDAKKDDVQDEQISLNPRYDTWMYKGVMYEDHQNLIKNHASNLIAQHKALAVNIRYTYLNLWNQGLARRFQDELHLERHQAIEGFSSLINHYFNHFYSAFPDLETEFGSKGSFFSADFVMSSKEVRRENSPPYRVYVNPPFDELLMLKAAQKVIDSLDQGSEFEFVFTIPGSWTDFEALDLLKASKWKTNYILHKKGTLGFINYMKSKDEIIFPCAIAEVTLRRK